LSLVKKIPKGVALRQHWHPPGSRDPGRGDRDRFRDGYPAQGGVL